MNEKIKKIQEIVAQEYNITIKDLKNKDIKTTKVVLAKQIAIYLVKALTDLSITEIGKAFGYRDYTTVIYAYNAIKTKLEVANTVNEIIKKLK